MEIIKVDIKDIKEYDKNAKKHPTSQIDKIIKSIKAFGFNVPVILTKGNILIAGHGRCLAAKKIGLKSVPAIYKEDLTDAQIKAYRIADNKTAESDWDFDFLKEDFESLLSDDFDLELTGFTQNEIDEIVGVSEIDECPADDPNEIETDIKNGDIFFLGEHRLMCGDATKSEDVGLLMCDEKADMVFTDPPYGIDKDILNDNLKGNVEYIKKSPADQDCYKHTANELTEHSGHPTEKMISHIKKVMLHFKTNLLYDSFGGSGSTLIACEQTNRKCFMMELDPQYCQVIINRWEKLTGKTAKKL